MNGDNKAVYLGRGLLGHGLPSNRGIEIMSRFCLITTSTIRVGIVDGVIRAKAILIQWQNSKLGLGSS